MHATFILKIAYLGTIVGGLQNKEGGVWELSMGKDSITKTLCNLLMNIYRSLGLLQRRRRIYL